MDNLDLVNHARKPDGVDYLCACLRYRGHNIAITCLSRRNPDSFPRQGYDGLLVDRGVARPVGDENFQCGLMFEWIIPTGHWVAVNDCGLANWLNCGFSAEELQPKVLHPNINVVTC